MVVWGYGGHGGWIGSYLLSFASRRARSTTKGKPINNHANTKKRKKKILPTRFRLCLCAFVLSSGGLVLVESVPFALLSARSISISISITLTYTYTYATRHQPTHTRTHAHAMFTQHAIRRAAMQQCARAMMKRAVGQPNRSMATIAITYQAAPLLLAARHAIAFDAAASSLSIGAPLLDSIVVDSALDSSSSSSQSDSPLAQSTAAGAGAQPNATTFASIMQCVVDGQQTGGGGEWWTTVQRCASLVWNVFSFAHIVLVDSLPAFRRWLLMGDTWHSPPPHCSIIVQYRLPALTLTPTNNCFAILIAPPTVDTPPAVRSPTKSFNCHTRT